MPPSGQLTISDWTMGICTDSGNAGLLPNMLRARPMQRSAYIAEVGVAKAAEVINTHVVAYYLLMYAWASERQVSLEKMEDASACSLCLQSAHVARVATLIWRAPIRGFPPAQRHVGHVQWNSPDRSWAVACAEPPGMTQGAVKSKLKDGNQGPRACRGGQTCINRSLRCSLRRCRLFF